MKCEFGGDGSDVTTLHFLWWSAPPIWVEIRELTILRIFWIRRIRSEMLVGTCRVWSISTSGTAPVQLSNDFETFRDGRVHGG